MNLSDDFTSMAVIFIPSLMRKSTSRTIFLILGSLLALYLFCDVGPQALGDEVFDERSFVDVEFAQKYRFVIFVIKISPAIVKG